ncbi:hypothetical protein PPMP20_21365 [Paraburkholderia phymatum]|uniref:XAC2610-related protein n=1 Tax=Paraburkholderia phymatum TaxID=148447 RepID=UPI0012FD5EE9|nr:hypothetical protein [Paraburkholderia phymatum]
MHKKNKRHQATLKNKLAVIGFVVAQFIIFHSELTFAGGVDAPQITVSGKELRVLMAGKSQVIKLNHTVNRDDIHWEDLNFDGHPDLKVLSSRGATQEFFDVYLYVPSTGKFIYNKQLSEVPCVQADAQARQVVGACFHESACSNWSERYSIGKNERLTLLERDGTYCDTSTGDAFSYVDRFSNGKRISSKVKPINSDTSVK